MINQVDGTPKLDALRTSLIDAISNPEIVPPYELKLLYIQTFHLPVDTPEMQQLHEIQNRYIEDHKETKAEIGTLKQENRYIRYIVLGIAIASGMVGLLSENILEFLIRGFGF